MLNSHNLNGFDVVMTEYLEACLNFSDITQI